MNPLNNIIMNKDITHQYKVPTPFDYNALNNGIEKLNQLKHELHFMQGEIQKYINIIGDLQTVCREAQSYASDCCDFCEEEKRPSAETIAGFYAKVMELKVLSSEHSDIIATMADSISTETIENIQQRTCDVVYCVNHLPFETDKYPVDNAQPSENNGTSQ